MGAKPCRRGARFDAFTIDSGVGSYQSNHNLQPLFIYWTSCFQLQFHCHRRRRARDHLSLFMEPKGIIISSSLSVFLYLSFLLLQAPVSVSGRRLFLRKPDPTDAAATARWLASQNSWGVLSTISSDLAGAPFGNVVSFSDGLPGEGCGVPYFYLTTLDPTARDALKDARASFAISEFPIGSCGKIDPENPTCAKLTLTGKMKLVDSNSAEAEFAQRALFSKHAEMKDWPKNHDFQIFKLDIENIFLIDWFGGPKPLSPAQYLKPRMSEFPLISLV